MNRRNRKKLTVRHILQSGSSRMHFEFLQNGALWLSGMPPGERALLATGTAGNEALHSEINARTRAAPSQHIEEVILSSEISAISKMLPRNSAAYSAATQQGRQKTLIQAIAAHMTKNLFATSSCLSRSLCRGMLLAR
eukprot:GEMP01041217.1.p2 GENE.GEMP01041217.1~~GEMP01041217.1.p2  ORF type:complete len:138 (-),score=18.66 GEMP01041217.1:1285-1698(-)